jgi:hypothetical protein
VPRGLARAAGPEPEAVAESPESVPQPALPRCRGALRLPRGVSDVCPSPSDRRNPRRYSVLNGARSRRKMRVFSAICLTAVQTLGRLRKFNARNSPSESNFSCVPIDLESFLRSPNFARACGCVPVGGSPDKRPESRHSCMGCRGGVFHPKASRGPAAGGENRRPCPKQVTQLKATTERAFLA